MQIRTSVSSAVRAWCASIGTLCATTCGTAPTGVTSPSECATVSPEYATITPDHNTERSDVLEKEPEYMTFYRNARMLYMIMVYNHVNDELYSSWI